MKNKKGENKDPRTGTQKHMYKEHMNDTQKATDKEKCVRQIDIKMHTDRHGARTQRHSVRNHPALSHLINFVTYMACMQLFNMC